MKCKNTLFAFAAACSLLAGPVYGQDLLDSLTLDDLLNVKVSVATKKATSVRSTPGIVSVITEEEIRNMGARDLIDVLLQVPGITFGIDVQGIVGIGVRGMWAHEGKYLLMIDGQEMNEILYSSNTFGNHYPVDQIKRIEIIRGPGSAVYGGFAELAVINVTTKSGEDIKGVNFGVKYGQMKEEFGRRNFSFSFGNKVGDWDYSFASFYGEGRLGEGEMIGMADLNGDDQFRSADGEIERYMVQDTDFRNPRFFNLGVKNSKFDFRVIRDDYQTTNRSQYGYSGLPLNLRVDFESWLVGANYKHKVSDKFTLTPQLNYKFQYPWKIENEAGAPVTYLLYTNIERYTGSLIGTYDVSERSNILVGAEFYKDRAEVKRNSSYDDLGNPIFIYEFSDGKQVNEYDNTAFFVQSLIGLEMFDVTLGARYDDHSLAGSSFVPRLALTKEYKNWHYKALAAGAFKSPGVNVIDLNREIKPENTQTLEVEFGHSVGKASYLTLNIFDTKIKDPIVYTSLNNTDNYFNKDQTGNRGLELDYRIKGKWGYANVGYSYYQADNNEVEEYQPISYETSFGVNDSSAPTVEDDKALLGMPQHKWTLSSSFNTGNSHLKLNPSVVYLGETYGYEWSEEKDNKHLKKFPAHVLANFFVTYDNILKSEKVKWNAGAGVFNIFDNDNRYLQPYDGSHAPLPGPSREVVVRTDVTYSF